MLQVRQLSFTYPRHPVLNRISLSVRPGELLAVLGPNGTGKTTLLKCLNGIHRADGGAVYIDGRDTLALRPGEMARQSAYVAQRPDSGPQTVFDAVLLGRKPFIRWKPEEKDLRLVEHALHRLHLSPLALRPLTCLSGGELQKVMIARALVQEPRLLLFDEPTSALDLKNQLEMLTLIREVVESEQLAGVMTLHDVNSALRFAHRFLFLKAGAVLAAGDISTVTPELIQAVYGVPVSLVRVNGCPVVIPVHGRSTPAEANGARRQEIS